MELEFELRHSCVGYGYPKMQLNLNHHTEHLPHIITLFQSTILNLFERQREERNLPYCGLLLLKPGVQNSIWNSYLGAGTCHHLLPHKVEVSRQIVWGAQEWNSSHFVLGSGVPSGSFTAVSNAHHHSWLFFFLRFV